MRMPAVDFVSNWGLQLFLPTYHRPSEVMDAGLDYLETVQSVMAGWKAAALFFSLAALVVFELLAHRQD